MCLQSRRNKNNATYFLFIFYFWLKDSHIYSSSIKTLTEKSKWKTRLTQKQEKNMCWVANLFLYMDGIMFCTLKTFSRKNSKTPNFPLHIFHWSWKTIYDYRSLKSQKNHWILCKGEEDSYLKPLGTFCWREISYH